MTDLDNTARAILKGNDRGGYTIPTSGLYPYQWNWDSVLAAWGFATFDIDRAWTEFETLFASQWDTGMVPHIIFHADDPGYFPGPDVWGTGQTRSAAQVPAATLAADPERAALAAEWQDYESSMRPSSEEIAAELAERTGSAGGAFVWYAAEYWDVLLFSVPAYLFWDALAMMLLGMALMKLGVISGSRSTGGYLKLLGLALPVGLTINSAEVWWRLETELDPLYLFSYFLPSYQFGRLAMGLAWMAALFLLLRGGAAGAVAHVGERLRAVGRMALTNYLMHSLVALVLFTGVGFGLAGELSRAFLYLIVIGIWAFQLWWSPRWLASHAYGPCEWLWRALTYGRQPPWKSAAGSAA